MKIEEHKILLQLSVDIALTALESKERAEKAYIFVGYNISKTGFQVLKLICKKSSICQETCNVVYKISELVKKLPCYKIVDDGASTTTDDKAKKNTITDKEKDVSLRTPANKANQPPTPDKHKAFHEDETVKKQKRRSNKIPLDIPNLLRAGEEVEEQQQQGDSPSSSSSSSKTAVVILTYNRAPFLERTVKSIQRAHLSRRL